GARRHPYLSLSSSAYQRWITKNTPSQQESEVLEKKCNQFKYKPLISIAVPVYNTEKIWLEKAADSVLNQLYDNWELCFVNDGSDSHVRDSLRNIKNKDGRIKVTHLSRNKGIAAASNAAIAMATGEYIAFMDADDELHPHALFEIVSLLNNHRDADIIYTDEDKLTLDNQRRKPVFKNDWSPDLFLTYNYINHLTLCKKELLDKIDGFRPEYNWSQDYDLYLRATEATD
ncbi:MAG: glycosyltransferase, partial [bacterium]|nr:glycosyltransferase [bacterium]